MTDLSEVTVRVREANIVGLVQTFGEHPAGELIALINEVGVLSVAVTNGNAGQRLGAQIEDRVEVLRS